MSNQPNERCPKCGDPLAGHRLPDPNCRYNGWTNYETWAVKLWMDNDEGSYHYWHERASEVYQAAEAGKAYPSQTREQSALYGLSEVLKDEFEEANPVQGASVFSDLMGAALSEVNWYEIAESLLDEVKEAEGVGE